MQIECYDFKGYLKHKIMISAELIILLNWLLNKKMFCVITPTLLYTSCYMLYRYAIVVSLSFV